MKKYRFLFTGGGTGGHVYPNIAIYEALKEKYPDAEFLYVGTRRGSEASVVPALPQPMDFVAVPSRGLPQRLKSPRTLLALAAILLGAVKSFFILRRFKPDVIIGDYDSVSDKALRCGADLVHHVHPDGRGPGREELQAAGVDYEEFWVEGTSEDAAMLLAYEAGASLIVAVGTHATMVEFLDKGRAGMSSTFLTRLRIGPILVDAKGISKLYEGRLRRRDLGLLILAVLAVVLVLLLLSDSLQTILDAVWLMLRNIWVTLTGNF